MSLELVLTLLNDRRAGMGGGGVGSFYLIMWVLTFLSVLTIIPRILKTSYEFLFCFLSFLAIFSTFLDYYSSRYIAASLVMLAVCKIEVVRTRLFLISCVVFLNKSLSMYYWV